MARVKLPWVGAPLGFLAAYFAVGALLPDRAPAAQSVERAAASAATEREVPSASLVHVGDGAVAADVAIESAPRSDALTESAVVGAAHASTAEDAPALVFGRVIDETGAPLSGAAVACAQPDGDPIRTQTDASGRFALTSPKRGSGVLSAASILHRTCEVPVDLALADAITGIRRDFSLVPRRVVRVRIVDGSGAPALPALVAAGHRMWDLQLVPVATSEKPGSTFTDVSGSLNNSFGIGRWIQANQWGLEPATEDEYGMVLVDEDGPAWLSLIASHQVLASQRIDDETRSVEFVVEPEDLDGLKGSVGLVAVDAETGAPLVARVTVGRDAFPNGGVSGETSAETGEITLEGVDPGERWLIVQADGRATSKQQVRIERGARLDVGMVALRAPVEIAGFVRDAEGKAYEAVVKWGRLDDATGRVEWARQTRAQSTADGRFRISDLEPGVYAVQAPGLPARSPIPHNARLASRAVRVDATSGSVADVSLELRGTSKLTLVTGDLAEPWATAIAIDASGLPADSTWLGRWGPEIELDLVDGVYTLVVLRDGEEIEERKISIVGHDVRIELDL